jgi:hypothetical protein
MDTLQLNKALNAIVEKKNLLGTLSYDDKKYDKIEEELHDLEDDFMDNFGDDLEEILQDVHDEKCPDNEVLMPIAYLANKYKEVGKNADGSKIYEALPKEGVMVDVDDFAGKDTRLVLIPNPTRLELIIDGKKKVVLWEADKSNK